MHFATTLVEKCFCSPPTALAADVYMTNQDDSAYNLEDILWYTHKDYAHFAQSILALQDGGFAHSIPGTVICNVCIAPVCYHSRTTG